MKGVTTGLTGWRCGSTTLTQVVGIAHVGDEHAPWSVRDEQRDAAGDGDRLRRDTAGPEHRHFAGAYRNRIAVVGMRKVGDAQRLVVVATVDVSRSRAPAAFPPRLPKRNFYGSRQ